MNAAIPPPDLRPSPAAALELFNQYFFARSDAGELKRVALLVHWREGQKPKPCPSDKHLEKTLPGLIASHVCGTSAKAELHGSWLDKKTGKREEKREWRSQVYRVGAYYLDSGRTKWTCLDFDADGTDHSAPLADATAAALASMKICAELGLPAYLERSGRGKGWHVWIFFAAPVPVEQARELGHHLVPRNQILIGGSLADPEAGRGIEVFPKQRSGKGARVGNMVWLPWWSGAAPGGNLFYRHGPAGELEPYLPTQFETLGAKAFSETLALAREKFPPEKRPAPASSVTVLADFISSPSISGSNPSSVAVTPLGPTQADWDTWRVKALEALPLETVYGQWLTGRSNGEWLECRDPSSPSGDQNPSAGVATGAGESIRGNFHSHRSGETLNAFDFMIKHGLATDMGEASRKVAQLSSVPLPRAAPQMTDEEMRAWTDGFGSDGGASPPGTPPGAGSKEPVRLPTIAINHRQERDVVAHAWQVVKGSNKPLELFYRGRDLVRLARRTDRRLNIEILVDDSIRELLSRKANWVNSSKEFGDTPKNVPTYVAKYMRVSMDHPLYLPELRGVVEAPILRPDGSILLQPGYDKETRLYFEPNCALPLVDPEPTRNQAKRAGDDLLDVFCDFPFASSTDKAGVLAAILTPFARAAFDGPVPMFVVDGNVRGAGKTKIPNAVGLIKQGREISGTDYDIDDKENTKQLSTFVAEGAELVNFDNVKHSLGGSGLELALTSTYWSKRLLGANDKSVEGPICSTFFATGNNVQFRGDFARRVLPIRLESPEAEPEKRGGFKYHPFEKAVLAERVRLMSAALTMLRAFVVAGRPDQKLEHWGSYEAWSALVRNAVVWAGFEDPALLRERTKSADRESMQLEGLIAGWKEIDPNGRGISTNEALRLLNEAVGRDGELWNDPYTTLRQVLLETCPGRNGHLPNAQSLGNVLSRHRGRTVVLSSAPVPVRFNFKKVQGSRVWFVEAAKNTADQPEPVPS